MEQGSNGLSSTIACSRIVQVCIGVIENQPRGMSEQRRVLPDKSGAVCADQTRLEARQTTQEHGQARTLFPACRH
jgi:hypothetical protein